MEEHSESVASDDKKKIHLYFFCKFKYFLRLTVENDLSP